MSESDQVPSREVALRAFATEFNDATHTFREEDDDMAPVYVLLPTGEKSNRVFVVGTLTETENVGDNEDYWRGRIVDPTGTIFTYAGQYQPDAEAFLRAAEPPTYVSISGKPRTYKTDDDTVNVSLRPEHIAEVDEATRQRWISETATHTLDRIEAFDDESGAYVRMAREQYGDNLSRYRESVIQALQSIEDAANKQPSSDDHQGDDETPAQNNETASESGTTQPTNTESMSDDGANTDDLL